MELKALEAFVCVAERQSFSKAAEMLYLTQPTVSAHVQSLEKELGVKLIDRTTKNLHLTEAGTGLYPYARRMLDLRDTITAEVGRNAAPTLNIGASTIPAEYLLPKVLACFVGDRTAIRLRQGNSAEIEELVCDGTLEIGVIGQEPQHAVLTSEKLCEDTMVLVTPANKYYTELRKKNVGPEVLMRQPMLLREDGSGSQKAADALIEELTGTKPEVILRSNNQETIKQLVAAGLGVSVMSYFAAKEMEAAGQVYCYILPSEKKRSFYIIYRSDRSLKEAAVSFIKQAAGICRGINS